MIAFIYRRDRAPKEKPAQAGDFLMLLELRSELLEFLLEPQLGLQQELLPDLFRRS